MSQPKFVWGMHVFREGDGGSKGSALEANTNQLLDQAKGSGGEDFFSALTRARFHGRPLTRSEMLGYCSIVFAGGRDTIINSISGVICHLATNAANFEYLREDPKRIVGASEGFFRVLSPSTHLARRCQAATQLHGVELKAGDFISLNFAAANDDPDVFPEPETTQLDLRPNPHVSFGFGPHLCLGAAHARLVIRTLIKTLCDRVGQFEVVEAVDEHETESSYRRRLNYDRLLFRMILR